MEGYSIKINHKKSGLSINCILEITVTNENYKSFQVKIQSMPKIEFCYRIAGKACYIAKLKAVSLEEVEEFINALMPFACTVTHIIFSEVKIDHSNKSVLNQDI
ncbi:hypothetical protein CVD28_13615 [Bacillus sp. M6-12]|uniref:Lrp/AsnC family transcriptional regulator n=1 Tax=Bacillus sp. M6-12 TaxID=2054166 RepID=UPI000C75DC7C|nr:hypothetical protein CVD28_13615 [Bacillus sp. M6-12]